MITEALEAALMFDVSVSAPPRDGGASSFCDPETPSAPHAEIAARLLPADADPPPFNTCGQRAARTRQRPGRASASGEKGNWKLQIASNGIRRDFGYVHNDYKEVIEQANDSLSQ